MNEDYKFIHLLYVPTMNCNMQCKYCYLKENTVDKWDLIEEAETIEINTNHKFINSAILKQIDLYLSEGFFDKYIDRYEYELKCFDRGNDLFESESMSQCNVK